VLELTNHEKIVHASHPEYSTSCISYRCRMDMVHFARLLALFSMDIAASSHKTLNADTIYSLG